MIDLSGAEDISLYGWSLRDESGNKYSFPALVLHSGAQVTVFTGAGNDTASELYWGRKGAIWNSGEIASLYDPDGKQQASYEVP